LPDPHKTKKCDHIVKIAEKHKYKDWRTVWSDNTELRNSKDRKNPLVLFSGDRDWPGDEIKLPPKDKPVFKQATDKDGVFELPKDPKLCLRLRILKADFSPVKDAPFELEIKGKGGKTYKGFKTTAEGRVQPEGKDPEIPNTCTEATLSVRITPEGAEGGDKKGGGGGGDKKDEAPVLANEVRLQWKLRIGRLNPIAEKAPTEDCVSGVQQRLNNLGFYCGPVDGVRGANTKLAVEKFQSLFGLDVNGVPDKENTQAKLEAVHDSDKPVKVPEGEKKPTKTEVKEKDFRKTTADDVGHVAPDFVDNDTPFVNTLVVAPEYRVKLDLGNIEDLFLHKPDSDMGRMERMQVVGLFYFPLHHKKAAEAFKFGWKYYCDVLKGSDDDLQKRIKNFVVDGSKLPPAADDPESPSADNFTKLRFPGGYTCTSHPEWAYFKPNHDKDYELRMLREDVHDAEVMHKQDNPVLGAIPLMAKVETRYGGTGAWKPAKDVMVYFQLVKPYGLPKYDNGKTPLGQINRPDLRDDDMQTGHTGVGPAKHVRQAMEKIKTVGDDPQVDNCPKEHGGKRGLPVADNVFELDVDLATHREQKKGSHKKQKRPGFYQAHSAAGRKDAVKEPFFEPSEDASVKADHAVRAKTNENGHAGVIFKPSTVGGDRYRIRVFVGPPTLESNGTDAAAVAVETGTMVSWRNIRVSKVRRQPCKSLASSLQKEIKEQMTGFPPGFEHDLYLQPEETIMFLTSVTKKDGTPVGYPDVDLSPEGDSVSEYKGLVYQMARSFCELELDQSEKDIVRDLNKDEWDNALNAAARSAKKNNKTADGFEIDVDELVITDKSEVNHNNSFVMIPVRMPMVYNRLASSKNQLPLDCNDSLDDSNGHFDKWFDEHLVFQFLHEVADRGYLPGLFILQVPTISTWHATQILGDYSLGLQSRCCILAWGKDLFPYPKRQGLPKTKKRQKREGTTRDKDNMGYSALALHEVGHCLFRDHAPPDPAPKNIAIHDHTNDGYCVMTYLTTEGDFCGKCLLAIQGWKGINIKKP
jgi:hypothetical protein